ILLCTLILYVFYPLFLPILPPPLSTLFPYTTLFRSPEYVDDILNSSEGNSVPQEQAKYLTFGGGGFPSITNEKYFQGTAENSPEAVEAAATLEPFLIDDPWPPFIYTEDEIDKLDTFGSDIDKYVTEMQDKFISGEASFDEWDDYVSALEKMNLDEYMDIKQAALERFEEN